MRMNKIPRVAIFGIGPSGLAAAHAVYQAGGQAVLMSRTPDMSQLHGCQYLHAPLPEVNVASAVVNYELLGSAEEYRQKVYGSAWLGKVSSEDFLGKHDAWDIRATYKHLWKMYVGQTFDLVPLQVNPRELAEHADSLQKQFDLVISTVPAKALCREVDAHSFHGHEIYAIGDAPQYNTFSPINPPHETVICNGNPNPSWYRISKVFGLATAEWPGDKKPPIEGVVKVTKPLWTNCTCFPWIERLGRYGAWRKGVLVHEVFAQTAHLMQVMQGEAPSEIRDDVCMNCGRIAASAQTALDGPCGVRYRCLSGHEWEIAETPFGSERIERIPEADNGRL